MSGGDWKLPWAGGCRCGRLRIEVTEPPIFGSACHCRGCQRMTGSAFALTLTLPATGLRVTEGEAVIGGLHAPELHHFHCGYCLSWVFTRPDAEPFVNLRASMLDDATWFRPFADMYVSERLPFAETGAPRRFERFPDPPEYPELAAAYASSGARP